MRKIQFALGAGGGFSYPDDASLFTEVDIDVPNMLVHATYSGNLPLAASSRHSTVFKETSAIGLTEITLDGEGGTVSPEQIAAAVDQAIAEGGFASVGSYEQNVSFPANGGSMVITHNKNALVAGCMLYDAAGTEYAATISEATVNSFRLTTSAAFTGKIVCAF